MASGRQEKLPSGPDSKFFPLFPARTRQVRGNSSPPARAIPIVFRIDAVRFLSPGPNFPFSFPVDASRTLFLSDFNFFLLFYFFLPKILMQSHTIKRTISPAPPVKNATATTIPILAQMLSPFNSWKSSSSLASSLFTAAQRCHSSFSATRLSQFASSSSSTLSSSTASSSSSYSAAARR